jgi:hypothetical protein
VAPPGGARTPGEHRAGLERQLDTSLGEFDGMLLREQQALAGRRADEALPDGGGTGAESADGSGAVGGRSGAAGDHSGGEGPASGRGSRGSAGGQPGAEGPSSGQANTGPARQGCGGQSQAGAGYSGGSPDTPAGEPNAEAPPPSGGRMDGAGGYGPDHVPPDVGFGEDDDIVARQLREAAMAEDDPELRERLWQEYRDYKRGEAPAEEPEQ